MTGLPFEVKPCEQDCGKECGTSLSDCPTYGKLPAPLQEKCQESLHLLQYLHNFPLDEFGMPEYYEKVTRSLKSIKDPNLIYPANDEIYVHILTNKEDIRDYYVAIEPSLNDGQDEFVDDIERPCFPA